MEEQGSARRPVGGEEFGQEERLTVRLRGLVRSYPRSVGIIKEILQNADDAGATWLRVVWDGREGASARPGATGIARMLGEALLFASDQAFSDEDLAAIRRIGESSKSELGPKTGRFGLGFNTTYNVTDYPSFVSGRWVICFDPHRNAVAAHGEPPGRRWTLEELWQEAPEWLASFCAAGLEHGALEHPGTIFRLPARTSALARESEICSEPFERSHFEPMVRDILEVGDEMILFARSVVDLALDEVDASGATRELVRLTTLNREEVAAARAVGNAAVEGDLLERLQVWRAAPTEMPNVCYRHDLEVRGPRGVERRPWQVAAGLYADTHDELLRIDEHMLRLRERAIPWAGAAVRLMERDTDDFAVARQSGKVFCTFHLPDQAVQVPLHINACFDLDSSRRQISADAAAYGEADRVRVAWNRALLRYAVPQAAATAISALAPSLADRGISAFYALWPDVGGRDGDLWRDFAVALVERLVKLPLVRTRAGKEIAWEPLAEVRLPPPLWGEDLQEALRDDGLRLPDPDLPARLSKAAEKIDRRPPRYRPAELRAWLREVSYAGSLEAAPRACLRERSHVVDLLQFCVSDRKDELTGLPLAITRDGQLRTFGEGDLFLADEATFAVFSDEPAVFIDPGVQAGTRLVPNEAARLREMGPAEVLERLALRLSPATPGGTVAWEPAGAGPPNEEWLIRTLRYLAERIPGEFEATLATLAIFPDHRGRLHATAGRAAPLLTPPEGLDPRVIAALDALGVEMVVGSSPLLHAIRTFHRWHGGPVAPLTASSLALRLAAPDVAAALVSLPAEGDARASLIDALAAPSWIDAYDDEARASLAALPLFRSVDGRVVAARGVGTYMPTRVTPPSLPGDSLAILDLGPNGRWRSLLERLGAAPLGVADYLRDHLLPRYGEADRGSQRQALRWLRDEVDRAALEASHPDLVAALRAAPLVLGRDGRAHPASALCDLGEGGGTFGALAEAPDEAFYADEAELWRPLFEWLGIRREPPPTSVLERVDGLLVMASFGDGSERAALGEILGYLSERWQGLEAEADELAAALRERAWLPGVGVDGSPGLFRPAELYLPRYRRLVASQAPVLEWAGEVEVDAGLARALGLDRAPSPGLVLDHLLAICQRVVDGGGAAAEAEVEASAPAIYGFLGGAEAGWGEDVLEDMRSRAAGRRCVWDPARRRLWRPEEAFAVPVDELFGERRGFVAGEGEGRGGLDRLGRRLVVGAADVVAVLEEIRVELGGRELDAAGLGGVLRLLRRLVDFGGDAPIDPKVAVPTREGRLVHASSVWAADAPWFDERLGADAIARLHPRVDAELIVRAGIRRLSHDVREELAARPALSGNPDKQAFCARLTATLQHAAFIAGVRRLLGPRAGADLSRLEALQICACDRLVTRLRLAGVDLPMGEEAVAVFADVDGGVVYVSGDHWDTVVVQIVATLRRLVDDAPIDASHLEALLRSEPAEIEGVLDHRRVPRVGGLSVEAAVPQEPPRRRAVPTAFAHERLIGAERGAGDPGAAGGEVMAAAVERVIAYERESGRRPEVMPAGNPAYDVQSGPLGGTGTRYIRVVGLDGPWDMLPVILSKNHFEAMRRLQGHLWLYVVENALEGEKAVIHRIRDPFSRVLRFTLDSRWSAETERESAPTTPRVGWIHQPTHGVAGVIQSIDSVGVLSWVHVRLPSGAVERRFFKPGLDRLSPPEE